jgi:hypothetical protein
MRFEALLECALWCECQQDGELRLVNNLYCLERH